MASEEDLIKACKSADALEFINALPSGFDTVLGNRGQQLSAGQLQRLALARALLRDARVLLCDELTADLDCRAETRVLKTLKTLSEDRNVIIVAHRPSTILLADNVVVLEQGRVVAVGTNSDLIRESRAYRELLGGYRFYEQANGL